MTGLKRAPPIKGTTPLCRLAKLGRDLYVTRRILRVASLRAKLRQASEFPGALFELEVLAQFARGGLKPEILRAKSPAPDFAVEIGTRVAYVEAQSRGSTNEMVVARRVESRLAFRTNDVDRLHVMVKHGDNWQRPDDRDIEESIISLVDRAIDHGPDANAVFENEWAIVKYLPADAASALEISFGVAESHAQEVRRIVR